MFQRRKSGRLVLHSFSHLAILPAKEQQRLAFPHHHVLDLRNKNGMVPCLLGRVQPALQIRERSPQHRSSLPGALKPRPSFLLSVLVRALRAGVIFRNRPLLVAQHIDPESFLGVQMRVRPRGVIHTHQHQHGVERHRGECIGRHAVHLAIEVHGDDRHPGGEAPHRSSKLGRIQSHRRRNIACNVPLTIVRAAGGKTLPATSLPNRLHYHAPALYHSVQVTPIEITPSTPIKRSACASALADIRPGVSISRQAALHLICCPDDELPELLAAARAAIQRFKPGIITYSRKVFLPLTNLCRDYCGYCTFRRDPGDPGGHTMTPDEVLAVARAGEKLGCTEALFSLGDKPELLFPEMRETLRHLGYKSTLHYLEAMCELVLRETSLLPHPNPGLLSAEWIARLAAVSPSMGLMLETTNAALLAPGAAHDHAPDKVPAKRLRTIEEAGKQNVPFTTGLLIGIGESAVDRVDTLLAIRDLQERFGHIQEVIVQNFRVKPVIRMANWPEATRGDMLRVIAVARLLLVNVNIQAPPNLSGPYYDYDDLVDAGINDWGGISPLTPDYINPEKPWPHLEQLRLRTAAKGFSLRQRLPVYPEFLPAVTARAGLLSEKLRAAADDHGLAKTTTTEIEMQIKRPA